MWEVIVLVIWIKWIIIIWINWIIKCDNNSFAIVYIILTNNYKSSKFNIFFSEMLNKTSTQQENNYLEGLQKHINIILSWIIPRVYHLKSGVCVLYIHTHTRCIVKYNAQTMYHYINLNMLNKIHSKLDILSYVHLWTQETLVELEIRKWVFIL